LRSQSGAEMSDHEVPSTFLGSKLKTGNSKINYLASLDIDCQLAIIPAVKHQKYISEY
jgi:hypothetical protein